jgi:opacity protein-like surface antigen
MKNLLVLFVMMSVAISVQAQGFAFGVKGGLTLGFQKWNGYERSPLPSYNGSIYIESLPVEKRFSVFGQLGYHVKGSRIKYQYRNQNGELLRARFDAEFRNVSLVLGMKSAYSITSKGTKAYYLLGIRGDYNINYNLEQKSQAFRDQDVNKFTYGLTLGGGLEVPFTKLVGMTLEMQISPDVRPQIFNPALTYENPITNVVSNRSIKVINTVFEITVGFRFLRVVEYEED